MVDRCPCPCSCPCPPGSCIGDQSLDFWRDAIGFFNRRKEQHKSHIFNARFILKSTTFIGSNQGVYELLNEKAGSFTMGYKEYLGHMFGEVVIFSDGQEAAEMRSLLCKLFEKQSVTSLRTKITGEPLCLYSCFKRLVSQILICLFLDLTPEKDEELIDRIIGLAVQHWHGIISIPVSIHVPLAFSSGYKKAADARVKLLEIAKERSASCEDNNSNSENSFLCQILELPLNGNSSKMDHLVLMMTALIPKAAASIISTFFLNEKHWKELRTVDGSLDEKTLDCILLETCRLRPAFIGGRRIAKTDVEIDGYLIPAKRPVVFLTSPAHRDPNVFKDPEIFEWKRWIDAYVCDQKDRERVFAFGGGLRSCIGEHFISVIMKDIIEAFLKRFDWDITNWQESQTYKWLPVSRPKIKPLATLSLHTGSNYSVIPYNRFTSTED